MANVVGTAIGEKFVNGEPTGNPAVLVFVQKKFSKRGVFSKFSADEMIPDELDGVPTDVIEVGHIVKQAGFKSKVRPLQPGYSCGHGGITAGTIGGFFRDKDGDLVMLSNNHVVADENKAKKGDPIFQPGPTDNHSNKNFRGWPDPVAKLPYFATLKRYVRLKGSGNRQDSGICKVHPKILKEGLIDYVYPVVNKRLQGWEHPNVGEQVQKCGRTTGYTTGRIIGQNASFSVGYDFGVARFKNCIVLSAMSRGGDSGSVIADLDMNAVGLLFAGSTKVTLANPIGLVKAHYGLELVTSKVDEPEVQFGGRTWDVFRGSGTLRSQGGQLHISNKAHNFCYAECDIDKFKTISCVVNSGSDKGVTWGPGLLVKWANGFVKVNVRYNRSFGGFVNEQRVGGIGNTKPNTDYPMRIVKNQNTIKGEVFSNSKWLKVLEVPTSVFPGPVDVVRIGKIGSNGGGNNSKSGKVGSCQVKDFKVT